MQLLRKPRVASRADCLQSTIGMPEIVADRFVHAGNTWIDLATGWTAKLRVSPAGCKSDQLVWNTDCAALANLRHPLLNPLIDYGVIGSGYRFEAYALQSPLRIGSRVAHRRFPHVLRFLRVHGVIPRPMNMDWMLRPVERAGCPSFRTLGIVLQRRQVYDAIAETLDAQWPCGLSVVFVAGAMHSGLRTTRLVAARLARLAGYMPLAAELLERAPPYRALAIDRHVCVLADEDTSVTTARALLTRLAAGSARRHVLLAFGRRPPDPPRKWIAIDRMGVTAMTAMVFVDEEQGPRPGEIFKAARHADGRPGACLEHLGSVTYDPVVTTRLMVHEMPQAYGDTTAATNRDRVSPTERRTDRLLREAVARSNALVMRGRHTTAARLLSRTTRVLRGRKDAQAAAETAIHYGFLLLDRGQLPRAAEAFERAQEAGERDPITIARSAIGLGMVRTDQGRLIEAEAILRTAAVPSGRDHGPVRVQAVCALARCLYWMGRLDEAALAIQSAPPVDVASQSAQLLAMRSRIEVSEGLIPAAVRNARGAVEMARKDGHRRALAAACRTLAAALASAGEDEAATGYIREGLAAAASAHLPLAAARLRLTLAEMGGAARRRDARRVVARVIARNYPPLLQAFARAVLARIEGAPLDAWTKSFVATSGALSIDRPSIALSVNPVTDLEAFLALGHTAPDDFAAIERIAELAQTKSRAVSVIVVATSAVRRILVCAGRPWPGDPHVAWRAAGGAIGIPIDGSLEPSHAAEPIRYSGEVIGAIAARWTAGVALDSARVSSMLRIASLALAAHVRAVLDRTVTPKGGQVDDGLLGDSQPTCTLRDVIARAARAPFPVLIQGESGSGKELVARTIHRLGTRRDRRFCALNCAALSDELIEAELFGHTRGAFTGAVGERAGLFEDADGGTLFLDEIGELSARAQAKLLRVLQDGEVRRVGENLSRRVDVRIIAATNRRLEQEAAAGRFRSDLRFRLDVIRIEVPPLRDRASDVPLLASRFWTEAAGRVGSRATLGPEAVAALARYEWPGNVRELQNVIAWIAVQSPHRGRVGPAALPAHIARTAAPEHTTFEAARQEFERRFVQGALAKADGQRARAAAALGITRQGLAKMMRRLGIE